MHLSSLMRHSLLFLLLCLLGNSFVLAADSRNAVVKVLGRSGDQGTGFIYAISKEHIFIVTARHVIGEDKTMSILFFANQGRSRAGVAGAVIEMTTGEVKDIALIKVARQAAPSSIEKVRVGFSVGVKKEQRVTIVGQPTDDPRGWVVDPKAEITDDVSDVLDFSSEQVRPGFSGGPVLDKNDLVVGMIGSDSVNSQDKTGRAIPIETVIEFVERSKDLKPQTNLVLNSALKLLFGLTGVVDYVKARSLFNAAANSGDPLSKAWKAYLESTGACGFEYNRAKGSSDFAKLLPEVEALSDQRVGPASFLLGYGRYFGWGTRRNFGSATEAFQNALEVGFEPARAVLADFRFRGVGLAASTKGALDLLNEDMATILPAGKVQLTIIYLAKQGGEGTRKIQKDLEGAAALGYPDAMLRLGDLYLHGNQVAQDIEAAKVWYARAVEGGDPLGRVAQATAAVWKGDPEEAADLLRSTVSDSNLPAAKVMLAKLIGTGMTSEGADRATAIQLLQAATEEGSDAALLILSICYLQGMMTTQDTRRGGELLREALDRKLIGAIGVEGICYANGFGRARDLDKAYRAFQRAANYNDPEGLAALGMFYKMGLIPNESADFEKALELFMTAAKRGSSKGYLNAGYMYAEGRGVEKDPVKAEELFQKALHFGDNQALVALVDLTMSNQDLATRSRDINKVRALLERYERAGLVDAKVLLGFLDLVFDRNQATAIQRVKTGSEMGSALGMNMMADLYVRGRYGVRHDIGEAERWAELAMATGDVSAVAQLGFIYWVQGKGEDARILWERAATQQHTYAMYVLALMHLYGQGGLLPDQRAGQELLKVAAGRGFQPARELLQSIDRFGRPPYPMPRIDPPGPR